MAIPDYQSLYLPFVKFAADEQEHHIREVIDHLTNAFNLSEEERKRLLPSGNDIIFNNRVRWARMYLIKAGLMESARWGFVRITQRGLEALKQNPEVINNEFLLQYPEFAAFKKAVRKEKKEVVTTETEEAGEETPLESLEYGYQKIKQDLGQQLLIQVKAVSSSFFEKLVVELIVKMGYGGSKKDAGEVIGRTGDGGIDGVIKQDQLGLDNVYIQAKRWENASIGRPELQKFVGALEGKKANKGIFITTSSFAKQARDYASTVGRNIVLIDGERLAQLMIDYNVGASPIATYEVKKIDSDYFAEE